MSALVDRALDAAGLTPILEARRSGVLDESMVERLREADLLVLGALADRVRMADVGDDVRIYFDAPSDDDASVLVFPAVDRALTGFELLREVAIARIRAPRGARIRIDWTRCGLELAQVAIGFGANELVGVVANKRGLPLAEGEKLGVGKRSRWEAADVVKRNELEGFMRKAGRKPIFGGNPT